MILRFADDVRIALVTILPGHVTDDCDRMRVTSGAFFGSKSATENRSNAQRVEIIRGDDSSDRTLGAIANAQRRARDSIDDERFEERRVLFEIEKVGIGKSASSPPPRIVPLSATIRS